MAETEQVGEHANSSGAGCTPEDSLLDHEALLTKLTEQNR